MFRKVRLAKAMFSATLRFGKQREILKYDHDARRRGPRRGFSPVICSPPIRMAPSLGCSTPDRILINVDLPDPFSPARHTASPGCDGEIHLVERGDAGITLGDARHLDEGGGVLRAHDGSVRGKCLCSA